MPDKKAITSLLPVPAEVIERRIYIIRGQKVMLDSDLAELYEVETRALNQAVRRNLERFPEDFMFQLSPGETEAMRSQFVTASKRNVRYLPYAFTEHGVAMLSSVLTSPRAVQMNIFIVRVFVKLRELLATHKDLAAKIEKLEAAQQEQSSVIAVVATEISTLEKYIKRQFQQLRDTRRNKRRIGFYDRGEAEKR